MKLLYRGYNFSVAALILLACQGGGDNNDAAAFVEGFTTPASSSCRRTTPRTFPSHDFAPSGGRGLVGTGRSNERRMNPRQQVSSTALNLSNHLDRSYKILGFQRIPTQLTEPEIKTRYHKLAKLYHPGRSSYWTVCNKSPCEYSLSRVYL